MMMMITYLWVAPNFSLIFSQKDDNKGKTKELQERNDMATITHQLSVKSISFLVNFDWSSLHKYILYNTVI